MNFEANILGEIFGLLQCSIRFFQICLKFFNIQIDARIFPKISDKFFSRVENTDSTKIEKFRTNKAFDKSFKLKYTSKSKHILALRREKVTD